MNQISGKTLPSWRNYALLRAATGVFALRISAAGLGFANGILLARLLGPGGFGVYSIALSAANFAAIVGVLGLPVLLTREVAAKAECGMWGQLRGLLRAAHVWTVICLLVLCVIAVTLFETGLVRSHVSLTVVIISMMIMVFSAVNQLRSAVLRGLHRVVLADLPDMLLRPASMLLMLGGWYLATVPIDARDALGMQLTAITVALLTGSWCLLRSRPPALRVVRIEYPGREGMLAALPFLSIAVVSTAETQVSLYLMGYLGSAGQAGLFQAANQLVNLIVFGLVAVNMPLQPKLAAAWARGGKNEAQQLISETARLGTAIALACGLLVLLFPTEILRLYGGMYVEASRALQILALGQIFNAVAGSCGILLLMTGHQRVMVKGTLLSLVLNGALGYFLIPHFGVIGGALGTTLGLVVWNSMYAIYAYYRLGIDTTVLRLFRG